MQWPLVYLDRYCTQFRIHFLQGPRAGISGLSPLLRTCQNELLIPINAKFTFCSLFDSLSSFQQVANLRIFTTLTIGRLNEAQCHSAIGMVEGGWSFNKVARRMGCSNQTIMKRVERNASTGSVSDRQRLGRVKITSQRQDQNMVLSHLRNRFRTAVKWLFIIWCRVWE